jgi:NADH-quinone oxidoreductase subunit C
MAEPFLNQIDALRQKFNLEKQEFRGEITWIVPANQLVELCLQLRDQFTFAMLENQTAVDYWPEQDPRFHLVTQLYSFEQNFTLTLRTPLQGNSPVAPTLEGLYPNANWNEREIWDMFGIRFEGHSDMRRILMPQDWEGHPQRKDYPLGYEEVQFTFNYDQISLHKPAPKE